jgi:hypothetical protein
MEMGDKINIPLHPEVGYRNLCLNSVENVIFS